MKKLFLACSLLLACGCTHLGSVSTTTIPKDKGHKVSAESYRFIFMLFNFDNDYVDTVVQDLAGQCPNGKITGILTKHEGITYFPIVAHAIRVTAEGYCNSHPQKKGS